MIVNGLDSGMPEIPAHFGFNLGQVMRRLDVDRSVDGSEGASGVFTAALTRRMRKRVIDDPSGDPYLTRWVIEEFADGSAIYLHRLHRSDGDREYHDHTFDFMSFIVSGSYIEQRPGKPSVQFRSGDWNVAKAEQLHRLEKASAEDVITVVFRGPKIRDNWGFQAEGGPWVPHAVYLDEKFGPGKWLTEYE